MTTITYGLMTAFLIVGPEAARAQEPVPPPVAPPGAPPAVTVPAASTFAADPVKVQLSPEELLRRRNAIFLMEGVLVNSVRLAANQTQTAIEHAQPDLKVTLFSSVPPGAWGNHLDDYGVLFQVLIPTYQPSVVSILNLLENTPRPRADAAQRASAGPGAGAPAAPLNPDAVYVEMVRQFLIDAMLDHSKALDLRPSEWLTVAARGADGAAGPVSEPSVMILRVKGSDLIDFLAGRLSRDDIHRRVQVRGFSGRR